MSPVFPMLWFGVLMLLAPMLTSCSDLLLIKYVDSTIDLNSTASSMANIEQTLASGLVELTANAAYVGIDIFQIIEPYNMTGEEICAQLKALQPSIDYCEVDQLITLDVAITNTSDRGSATPNDALYNQQWGIKKTATDAFWAAQKVYGNRRVLVCHVDSGLQADHPDLADSLWTNPNEIPDNGIDDDDDGIVDDVHGASFTQGMGSNDFTDMLGHGTHTAGIIGATGNNAQGTTGVNQIASIIPCRFITSATSGSTSDAILCLNYCVQHNAQIISCSWGGTYLATLDTAIQAVTSRNILVVASAGNSGINTDTTPQYPSGFSTTNNAIIGVAATTSAGPLWSGTNYGSKSVQIAAPGADVVSTFLMSTWKNMTGSSMAGKLLLLNSSLYTAPHVSGAAALVTAKLLQSGVDISSITNYGSTMRAAIIASGVPFTDTVSATKVPGGQINVPTFYKNVQKTTSASSQSGIHSTVVLLLLGAGIGVFIETIAVVGGYSFFRRFQQHQ